MINLAVLIVHAKNGAPLNDPIFYLVGGPGGSATLSSAGFPVFERLNENRDIVFVDPRGAGYSIPNLFLRRGGFTLKAFARSNRNFFQSQGIDVTGYNSTEIARDYDAVRQALGYSKINIFANSYGTFVAQEMIRRFPATIRALVMSGNSPATDPFLPTSLKIERDGITALLRDVRNDRISRKTYPQFRRRFYKLLDRLNENPLRLALTNVDTGRAERVIIDGYEFLGTISGMLQRTQTLRLIPMLVEQMEQENYSGLVRRFFAPSKVPRIEDPFGMYLSVLGTDFATPGYVRKTTRGIRKIRPLPLIVAEAPILIQLAQLVVAWDVPYSPGTTRTLPTGDVPTLLLNGQMDAQTPVTGGALIARNLSNAVNFVYPRIGHAVGFDKGPPMYATIAFFENPALAPKFTRGNLARPGFYKGRPPREKTRGIDDWKHHLPDPPVQLRR